MSLPIISATAGCAMTHTQLPSTFSAQTQFLGASKAGATKSVMVHVIEPKRLLVASLDIGMRPPANGSMKLEDLQVQSKIMREIVESISGGDGGTKKLHNGLIVDSKIEKVVSPERKDIIKETHHLYLDTTQSGRDFQVGAIMAEKGDYIFTVTMENDDPRLDKVDIYLTIGTPGFN